MNVCEVKTKNCVANPWLKRDICSILKQDICSIWVLTISQQATAITVLTSGGCFETPRISKKSPRIFELCQPSFSMTLWVFLSIKSPACHSLQGYPQNQCSTVLPSDLSHCSVQDQWSVYSRWGLSYRRHSRKWYCHSGDYPPSPHPCCGWYGVRGGLPTRNNENGGCSLGSQECTGTHLWLRSWWVITLSCDCMLSAWMEPMPKPSPAWQCD